MTRVPAWVARTLLAAACAIAGCSESEPPPTGPSPPAEAPEPTSAVNAATRVRFAFADLDTAMTRGLYTYDYAFLLHPLDVGTYGDTDGLLSRDEELEFARRVREAPPSAVTFDFQGTPSEAPDGRPGRDPRYHRRVDAGARVEIREGAVVQVISGAITFFLVRGDSAAIDDAIRGASTLPDSSRWYVERIEDGTGGPLAAAERQAVARNLTLGAYKLMRLNPVDLPGVRAAGRAEALSPKRPPSPSQSRPSTAPRRSPAPSARDRES